MLWCRPRYIPFVYLSKDPKTIKRSYTYQKILRVLWLIDDNIHDLIWVDDMAV